MTATTPDRTRGEMDDVLDRMAQHHETLVAREDELRHYHGAALTLLRHVADEAAAGRFVDPGWVLAFQRAACERYLESLERREGSGAVPAVWEAVDRAGTSPLSPVRHLLLGLLAARDYDAPLALLALHDDHAFVDAAVVSRHAKDHVRLDEVARDVSADVLADLPGPTPSGPVAHAVATRLLTATRWGAWRNARLLSRARADGRLAVRVEELEERVVDRLAVLAAPGPGLVRLARGVTVELPPGDGPG